MKASLTVLLALGCALVVVAGAAASSSVEPALRRSVIASGGGTAASASIRLHGTAGQPLTGASSSSAVRLSAGFWLPPVGAVRPVSYVRLPVVFK